MNGVLKNGLSENESTFKWKLKGIIDKYSKAQYQDGIDVDFTTTTAKELEHYMVKAEVELSKQKSELDLTQDSESEPTCASTTQYSVENDGMASNDMTVGSLDESKSSLSETEVQPEDQDEELEMTLRSNGSSLVELYPSMISRIERAWHRQQVSEAADLVLRRYRRWRQQSHVSNLSNTFIVPQRHTKRNPKHMTSQTLPKEDTISPAKRPYMGAETFRSPLKVVNVQDWQAQRQYPRRMRTEQHQPVLVMDFSEQSMPNEISLNKTFTVSEASQLEEQPSTYTFSPSRPHYPTGRASLDPSLRPRRLSLTAHSPHTDGYSPYASEAVAAMERSDIYGSPGRQSPSRARMMSVLSRSPHAFARSPRAHSMESFSKEPPRHRLMSVPPQKPTGPQKMLYPQDSPHSHHPQLRSPQPASAAQGHCRLRRHLSFDSSQPTSRVFDSPKKLDEDFLKLYHKFVCQNKSSFFNKHRCRLCAKSSEANRGPSSSLAALALSPHCSLLRKRHRELDNCPQPKRSREEHFLSSPKSRFHRRETLKRRLTASEYEPPHEGSTQPSMLQNFSPQSRSADAHQETWMNRCYRVSAADFPGTRSSLESRMASGSSPRKWW